MGDTFNYSTKKATWPDFGDYAMIEQKRFGVPNEMFMHKVVGRLGSNTYFDIPAQTHLGMKNHGEVVDVVRVICCGIDETRVLTFRVEDVHPCSWMSASQDKLIAAAPDLLHALKTLLHACHCNDHDAPDRFDACEANARAAIAKATGSAT